MATQSTGAVSDPRAAASGPRPSAARVWLLASRPHTLPASAAGVVVGVGAAVGAGAAFRPDTALACLLAALLLQVFANLANDYSDFIRGADTPDRLGPTRVMAAGLLSAGQMRLGMFLVALVAGADGLLLTMAGGPAILALGVSAVVAAIAYTGGPWPFGYKGLGELFVFLFFGPVCVIGTAFLQSGGLDPLYVAAAVPPGAFATAILVTNNLRDVDTDGAAGKGTLAVRFGPRFARAEYPASFVAAWGTGLVTAPWHLPALATVLLVPGAVSLVRSVYATGDPRRLNVVLKWTGRLGLAFGVVFAAGLAIRV